MNTKLLHLSLKLFNAVLKGESKEVDLSNTLAKGLIIDNYAIYAAKDILYYFKKNKLSAEQLNATFHKSWLTIQKSSRLEE
ncbi:MAG: hypothetical protein MK212_05605 [Saprospiraceae bacterium]|nr:hypothetical protein [Saprospiraceae bacterium]